MVAASPPRRRRKNAPRLEPIAIGPTWRRDRRGDFELPRHSLGWAALDWASNEGWLQQPDGPDAGSKWEFTPEQARFLLWFYAVNSRGEFEYRRAVLRRLKGWGKDPFGAVLCAIEFLGPCRFGGWNENGTPIVVDNPAAWIQTVGVAKDQTKNTMTLFPGLFTRAARETFDIDVAQTIIYAYGGARRIEAITSSPDTSEGNRPTFILQNETQHWTAANRGVEVERANARNLAKARDGSARALSITNAHKPGEGSVAETDYRTYLDMEAGRLVGRGLLYDSLEAPATFDIYDRAALLAALDVTRGDSWWVNPERLADEVYDPHTPIADSRRFYLNQVTAAEDAWMTPQQVDGMARPGRKPEEGALVTLGLSGLRKTDSTALMGFEVETGLVFTLGVWEPPAGGEVPRALVDDAVDAAFERYDVVGFYSRLNPYQAWVEAWEEKYGDQPSPGLGLCARVAALHPIAVDENARVNWRTKAAEAFLAGVVDGAVVTDGDVRSQPHFLAARRLVRANGGIDVRKETETSTELIDAARAAILARQAAMDYLALPEKRQRQRGYVQVNIW